MSSAVFAPNTSADRAPSGFEIANIEPVGDAIRRIAAEEIDKALAELDKHAKSHGKRVHETRKRCKRLRGLARLVRYSLVGSGDYRAENRTFRDASRRLAPIRDAQVLIDTHDALVGRFGPEIDRKAYSALRRLLSLRKRRVAGDASVIEDRMEETRRALLVARQRVGGWEFDGDGFGIFAKGIAKTYRRGRRAFHALLVADDPHPEFLHEWRKRTKYHGFHLRFLQGVWPRVMEARYRDCSALSELLGDEHDLSVFVHTLESEPGTFGKLPIYRQAIDLADRRKVELQEEALTLGAHVYAEPPNALVRMLDTYWDSWRPKAVTAPDRAPVSSPEPAAAEGPEAATGSKSTTPDTPSA